MPKWAAQAWNALYRTFEIDVWLVGDGGAEWSVALFGRCVVDGQCADNAADAKLQAQEFVDALCDGRLDQETADEITTRWRVL